jgi:hypothetical protein
MSFTAKLDPVTGAFDFVPNANVTAFAASVAKVDGVSMQKPKPEADAKKTTMPDFSMAAQGAVYAVAEPKPLSPQFNPALNNNTGLT